MSILLDALKKSEQQRQLGTSPDIHSGGGQEAGGARPEGQPWVPAVLMVIAVVAMAWFGWNQYRAPDAVPPGSAGAMAVESSGQATGEATSEQDAQSRPDSGETAGARRPGLVARARSPVESLDGEAGSSGQEPAAVLQEDTAERERQELKRQFSSYKPEPGRTTDSTPAAGKKPASSQPVRADAAATSAARPEPATPAVDRTTRSAEQARSQTQPQNQPRARPQAGRPQEPQPISFWELPQSVRDGLPELRITVLVYADKPESRFALINGTRRVENDEIEGGVVLAEIRREGAVFTYRKYRFLVKG